VTITDTIPQHTQYVDGSADNGGVFENGAVVWELTDIPAWGTVTVTFKVTVNAQIGTATIENKAIATQGNNSCESNVVSNHTVYTPTDDDIPKTGISTVLISWMVMQIIGGGGFIATAIYGKKKKAEEA